MWYRFGISFVLTVLVLGILVQGFVGAQAAKPPSIEGTYRLVLRERPDGTKQTPPDMVGFMTFTKEYRNVNICVKDANGKPHFVSIVATYKLTEKEYSEKSIYHMVADESSGKGLRYELAGASGTSPVSITGRRIEFRFPLHEEPSVVFDGDKFTASRPGEFVDHWEKVK